MKNCLIKTIPSFLKKYHFISRDRDFEVQVWVEKFSTSYDTGYRLSQKLVFKKNTEYVFEETVNLLEGRRI